MPAPDSRRPLASRDTAWARAATRRLAALSVTPNQVSVAGVGFAVLAALCLFFAPAATGPARVACLVLAAAGCQMRLMCNLLDGLLAVEAGKGAADGPFWNEAPDRLSDIVIMLGLGAGLGLFAAGWAAGCLCVLTAYLRELGRALGFAPDYGGPLAKPQRMAVVTAAALLTLADPLWSGQSDLLRAALWLICAGTALTAGLRAGRLLRRLNAG